jgi:radical SAM superfamily enzyme YgiQ (UPF0313 family)
MRPPELVLEDISSMRKTGATHIGVIAPESGDYPWIEEVLREIKNNRFSVSFASMRIDSLSDEILSALSESGQRTLTIAPETGDDELRKSCGKSFTNDIVIEKLRRAKEKGIQKVKMYFMIGLPGEAREHILETAKLIEMVRKETNLKTVASLSIFVPKPQTAWRNEQFASSGNIKEKAGILRRYLAKSGSRGIELRLPSYREAAREYRLAWCSADAELDSVRGRTEKVVTIRTSRHLDLLGFTEGFSGSR